MNTLLDKFKGVIDLSGREADLLSKIDPNRLPRHIAVIMDGNGRWAKQRNLPRVAGHKAGISAVRAVVETAARLSVRGLTLYAFSVENWKRPRSEVNMLMGLLKDYLRKELSTIMKNNIRFKAIGRLDELPTSVQRELKYAEDESRNNQGTQMTVALNYSGRLELVDSVNSLLRNGASYPIGEEDVESGLYTIGLPELDLLIRTSGEMRISNFLLWQIAYAEIHVTEVLWPDFRGVDLLEAVLDFQTRERRYGGIHAPSLQSTR